MLRANKESSELGGHIASFQSAGTLYDVFGKYPVGRLGEPDEIARVVEFLADPDSGFITGQIYSVNGGQYM